MSISESNIFDMNDQAELYIMFDHLLKTQNVIAIEPYYQHGDIVTTGIFENNANVIYMAIHIHFHRADNLAQMVVVYNDGEGSNETISADSIFKTGVTDNWTSTLNHTLAVIKYIVSATSATTFNFLGFKVTLA